MKQFTCIFTLGLLAIVASCNPRHIEAKREGLIPIKAESRTGSFGLEHIEGD